MKTLELKDIFGYFPHRLNVYEERTGEIYPVFGIELREELYHCSESEYDWFYAGFFKPILRPLADLYRLIIHNGKEQIPIVECAKITFPDEKWVLKDWGNGNENGYAECSKSIDLYFLEGHFKSGLIEFHINQIPLFDYLHELKIDYRGLIDAGLAIDCNTLENNPYK